MPRKKRQAFQFPQADQPASDVSDAELDAFIDAEKAADAATDAKKDKARKLKADGEQKKAVLDAAKAIPEIFKPEDVKFAFDVYVGVICFLFSIAYKCDFTALYEELKLDEPTKEHLAKPLAKVFSKYAPAEWAGMTAEIELISFVGIWTVAAMPRAKTIADKEKQRKLQEQRGGARNPVTAMSPQREVIV